MVRVGEIESEPSGQRWLVEELWGASSVGVIGGAPKCAKTWLGLDMTLSVATGTACLGKYAVPEPGPVLVYLAEDALPVVRERVEGMARHRGLDLARVEIHVITAPTLRLDRDRNRMRLLETSKQLRPRLLVLDPLVLSGLSRNWNVARLGYDDLNRRQNPCTREVSTSHQHRRQTSSEGISSTRNLSQTLRIGLVLNEPSPQLGQASPEQVGLAVRSSPIRPRTTGSSNSRPNSITRTRSSPSWWRNMSN